MTALAPGPGTSLTVAESDFLAELEETIRLGLHTFREVGQSLGMIRDNRLYRVTHASFEDYASDRWGLSRPRAYELMAAAALVSAMADSGLPLPDNERQARELARLPEDQRDELWLRVLELTGGQPTAAAIRAAAEDRRADTPGDEDGSAPSAAGTGDNLPPVPASSPGLAGPADSEPASPSSESGPAASGGEPELVDTPIGPMTKDFADQLDRLVPDPDPHADWRIGYLKRIHAVHAVIRSKPADVAEMADATCLDELTRCVDALNTYHRDVERAVVRSTPDNVRPIRRTS